ncbi:MAG: co-chaperone GroES [Patescibacteria group bacterium]|nr:co-chaperone GroES [Patescibacteria group bacterium]
MSIKPLGDNVIIKAIAKDEKTKSGIVLPETIDKEKPEEGEVIAIGPGKMLDNGNRSVVGVKEGDTVLFKKYSPDEIKADGKNLLVISESDIIAIIK